MKRLLLVTTMLVMSNLSANELLIQNVRLLTTSFESGVIVDLRVEDGIITEIGADLAPCRSQWPWRKP